MYTQEELEAKSDFEITYEIVTNFLIVDFVDIKDEPEIKGQTFVEWFDGFKWHKIDLCNSWADMGPIINEIWLELKEVIYIDGFGDARIWDYMINRCSGNKLRAAAIVYLLME